MNTVFLNARDRNLFGLLCVLLLLAGCSILPTPAKQVMDQYVLEDTSNRSSMPVAGKDVPVLLVSTPRAHGGYDTHRIAYMEKAFGLRYYTRSRWADTPARMLAPLVADAMEATGQFQALYTVPGSIAADYRLDTELIRFHQDFTQQPVVMHITLRAQLIDLAMQQVLATQQFDITEPVNSADAYGGVVAANAAVHRLLDGLAQFCTEHQR